MFNLPQINLDANTTHFILAAFFSFVGYEARQWRIWYMNNHGGSPDGSAAKGK